MDCYITKMGSYNIKLGSFAICNLLLSKKLSIIKSSKKKLIHNYNVRKYMHCVSNAEKYRKLLITV